MITGPGIKYDAGDRSSLDTRVMYRFGGSTKTNYTNKIYTYVNSTQKLMTNSPKIMVGSTLTNIKGIWVGSKEVFGSKVVTDGGKLVNYMYYINGSWKSSLDTESVAAAKSYVSYSGNVLYGVYVGSDSKNRPNIYFKGKILKVVDVSNNASGLLYVYNNYVVAIFNPYTIYMTNKVSHTGGSAGTLATKAVNIPPGVVAFFNIEYCQPSGGGGSGSGSGSASSSSGLTDCYLTVTTKSANDTKVTLDFTGANNFQATP